MDTYHTRLRQLATKYEFADSDSEIKSQNIQSYTSSKLRRKALSEEMTLTKLLETARTLELAEIQASGIENNNSSVNKMHQKESGQRNHQWKPRRNPEPRTKGTYRHSSKCYNCGGQYPHKTNVQHTNKSVIILEEKITSLLIVSQNLSLRKNMSSKSRMMKMMDTYSASGTTL